MSKILVPVPELPIYFEEGSMAKRRGKASFDAMVKLFMQTYNIPTKRDINNLMSKIDRLEKLVKSTAKSGKSKRISENAANKKTSQCKSPLTASSIVIEVIKEFEDGICFSDIRTRTGFAEKKLRNVIFRLDHIGKIERKSRGVYVPEGFGK